MIEVADAAADATADIVADVFGWILIVGWIATVDTVARLWFRRR